MTIQIFGPGCAKCQQLAANAAAAVSAAGLACEVAKVADFKEMVRCGVLATPALAIDGKLQLSGRVATVDEIRALLDASAH